MSKVYEHAMEMAELEQDSAWNEAQEEQERLAQEETFSQDEETKAKKFVELLLEAS